MGQICSCFSDGSVAAETVPVMAAPTMAAQPVAAKPPAAKPPAAQLPAAVETLKRKSSVHRYAPKQVQDNEVVEQAKVMEQHAQATKILRNRRKSMDAIFTLVDKNGDDLVSKRDLKNAIKAQGPEFAARLGMKHGLRDVEKCVAFTL